MIQKETLESLYLGEKHSVKEIASLLQCTPYKIDYWLTKYGIPKRSQSQAAHAKNNTLDLNYKIKNNMTVDEAFLYGMGLGLFWGEGNKVNKYSVRLGNTDAKLLETFILFLEQICDIPKDKLKFGLQIFTDIDPEVALHYWMDKLQIKRSQFYKITVTISGSIGTYRKKSRYGVLQIYYNNKKFRDFLIDLLPL